MGDRDRGQLVRGHLVPQHVLDQGVRPEVHARRRLVQHQDAAAPQECARGADKLPLAHGEVVAARCEVVPEALLGGEVGQLHVPQLLHDLVVASFPEGVHVEAERAREAHRVLRDDRQPPPEGVQPHVRDVGAVDRDPPRVEGAHAEQGLQQRALPCARAADDAHAGAPRHGEGYAVQHRRQVLPVAHGHALEPHLPAPGPALVPRLVAVLQQHGLRAHLGEGAQALQGDQAQLRVRQRLEQPLHVGGQLQRVPQDEAHGAALHGHAQGQPREQGDVVVQQQEQGHQCHWGSAEGAQTDGEPPVAAHDVEYHPDGRLHFVCVLLGQRLLYLIRPQGADTCNCLVEPLKYRTLVDACQALQLSRSEPELLLNRVVIIKQRQRQQQQHRHVDADDDEANRERHNVICERRDGPLHL
mmetsp:Transcript_93825/g.254660  ORF Transcript_93825/g.254660 Transcript_93825/m.254660 type:complete len:414 (+) Transcript_93825:298-1539(+)